ncbi:LPXTG cell wall anchor domain-containing protein [Streptomyces hoynatensis]|uniref:LPXTG cell wall anchor domain-containing protein n=1 Tax=Streptomyces hoynatensis TaxID=1141874 RepID=A0A3A9YU88_9ACTN|nr:LPXTG cell wall anchor domain-containing protein [Streptomyces hoynatensis]RKN39555.1 LPXTG cell wall anchor domain-containing protein [Streptomyces hoynatensis]
MKPLHPRGSRRLAVTAATLLTLGLATPALAAEGAGTTAAEAAAPALPGWSNSSPLTISPSSGGAGTRVTVRATCRPSGPATSQAFQQSITLRQTSNHQWTGTGTIKTSGLVVGQRYPVTVPCDDGTTLTTNFTFTATPTGGAAAGFGGAARGGDEGGSQTTALAVGGGIALAGAAGYVFLARRRRSTGDHY